MLARRAASLVVQKHARLLTMAAASEAKRPRTDRQGFMQELYATIDSTPVTGTPPADAEYMCTHHGSFHCDEALGVGMLKLLPQYARMPLVRTRKTEDIDGAAIVLDVGGTYDPEAKRFDHHQPEFQDSYDDEHDIRLSSAGLIFKHFGAEV
ncbi:unnamed protein product, partial [Symbiodinium sp. KB8]